MAQDSQVAKPPIKSTGLISRYEYSGPIPPPEMLNKFDEKTRSIIVKMAERQSTHRQQIERNVISSNSRNESVGMVFSLVITLFMMILGAYLVHDNKDVVGFLTMFSPAVFQAKNYYDQRRREKGVSEK